MVFDWISLRSRSSSISGEREVRLGLGEVGLGLGERGLVLVALDAEQRLTGGHARPILDQTFREKTLDPRDDLCAIDRLDRADEAREVRDLARRNAGDGDGGPRLLAARLATALVIAAGYQHHHRQRRGPKRRHAHRGDPMSPLAHGSFPYFVFARAARPTRRAAHLDDPRAAPATNFATLRGLKGFDHPPRSSCRSDRRPLGGALDPRPEARRAWMTSGPHFGAGPRMRPEGAR